MILRDVIERAMRLNGELAAGEHPGADAMADMITAANAMKAAWFGALIGGRLTEQAVAGALAQAENGGEYPIPSVAFTLTAPASPRSGMRFAAVDATLDFATHNLTVDPNGRQIEGATGSLVINVDGDNRQWWYRGDAGNWVRQAPWADENAVVEFGDSVAAYFPYMLAVVCAAEFNTELRADIIAGAAEGRAVMARMYAPRGRNLVEASLGAPAQLGQG
ncbi:MAG TPA: hypothetical protein VG166_09170 [Caulobacteraceae bacterium]|jgi:hypothetical protein|nr:hypothetical protein [Caulobacteraceae bacterium]